MSDLCGVKDTLKDILKPARNKSQIVENILKLVRLFHQFNLNIYQALSNTPTPSTSEFSEINSSDLESSTEEEESFSEIEI